MNRSVGWRRIVLVGTTLTVLSGCSRGLSQPAPTTAPAPPEQDITGDINAAKALKFLYGNFDPAAGTAHADNAPETLVSQYLTQAAVIDGKPAWFLYTTSNAKGNDCHACSATLGAALFVQEGQRWIKRAENRNVASVGSFGAPPEGKPVQWGPQAYGILIHGGWVGYGQISGWDDLFG